MTTPYYSLFDQHNATHLLSTGRHSGHSTFSRLLAFLKANTESASAPTVAFNGDELLSARYVPEEDKDIFKVSTYDKCYSLRALSDTEVEVTLYNGDMVYGEPEPISSFSTALSVKSAFLVTAPSQAMVQALFPDALTQLSQRLTVKEQERAEQQRFEQRQQDVRNQLKMGTYDHDEGVAYFLGNDKK